MNYTFWPVKNCIGIYFLALEIKEGCQPKLQGFVGNHLN